MLRTLQKFLKGHDHPLNKVLIDKNRLLSNYQNLSGINERIQIAPIIKSNAYGHGLTQVAPILDKVSAPFIGVDSIHEAYILKKIGLKTPILIMGAIDPSRLEKKSLPFDLTITDMRHLELFEKHQPNAKIHLFIDTGMNREGISMDELNSAMDKLRHSPLNLVGVMTHLAVANDRNHPLTKLQIENFKKARKTIQNNLQISPKWWHIGGGDAIVWADPEVCNIVRAGRLVYGVSAKEAVVESETELKPVMQLETTIVQLKDIKKGENVGYFATYTAQKDLKSAVLPIGYNDGVDKRLSNKGIVLVKGVECPIIGLISMNMMVIDVTEVKEAEIGTKVTVFSCNPEDKNSFEKAAELVKTNPSDLLVGLHTSTRREIRE